MHGATECCFFYIELHLKLVNDSSKKMRSEKRDEITSDLRVIQNPRYYSLVFCHAWPFQVDALVADIHLGRFVEGDAVEVGPFLNTGAAVRLAGVVLTGIAVKAEAAARLWTTG